MINAHLIEYDKKEYEKDEGENVIGANNNN
jgi:hypothetical protein